MNTRIDNTMSYTRELARASLMSWKKAEDLADTLNSDPEDDWMYEVVFNHYNRNNCTVLIRDETGQFVGFL